MSRLIAYVALCWIAGHIGFTAAWAGPSLSARTIDSSEFTYSRFPLEASSESRPLLRELRARALASGWYAFDTSDQGGIPGLASDQVFFNSEFTQFIALKTRVRLKQPQLYDRLLLLPSSQVVHIRTGPADEALALSFIGLSDEQAVEAALSITGVQIREALKVSFKPTSSAWMQAIHQMVPMAQAQTSFGINFGTPAECSLPDSAAPVSRLAKDSLLVVLLDVTNPLNMDCLVNKLRGAYDSTIGGFIDTLKGMGAAGKDLLAFALHNPGLALTPGLLIQTYVAGRLINLSQSIRAVWGKMDGILPGMTEYMRENPHEMAGFICKLMGSLSTDVILIALTDGAGAVKYLEKVVFFERLFSRLTRLSRFAELFRSGTNRLALSRIYRSILNGSEIGEAWLSKADRLRQARIPGLASALMGCSVP